MSEKVRFLSEFRSHRMLRKPFEERIMGNNSVAITATEIVYEFENGGLDLRPGQDVLEDKWDEETATFVAQDAISWIRSTKEFLEGVIIEVKPQAPDPTPLFVEIGKLEGLGDLDGLYRLGQEEHDSWDREPVLTAAKAAIDRIEAEAGAAKT